jgi:hypothetical protein
LEIEAAIEILENTKKLLKLNNTKDLVDLKKEINQTLIILRKNRKWSVERF